MGDTNLDRIAAAAKQAPQRAALLNAGAPVPQQMDAAQAQAQAAMAAIQMQNIQLRFQEIELTIKQCEAGIITPEQAFNVIYGSKKPEKFEVKA